jgi:hypothetical protein
MFFAKQGLVPTYPGSAGKGHLRSTSCHRTKFYSSALGTLTVTALPRVSFRLLMTSSTSGVEPAFEEGQAVRPNEAFAVGRHQVLEGEGDKSLRHGRGRIQA